MWRILLTLVFCAPLWLAGQYSYKSYVIEWDSVAKTNYVRDTLTDQSFEINYPFSNYPHAHRFRHGLVYVRTGDMKGLMDLKGNKLLQPSHYIHFNSRDSIISAYVCHSGSWVFLNFEGDTLSYGRTRKNNYCPSLSDALTPAHVFSPADEKLLWGYLNQEARWAIKPIYEEVLEFEQGQAKVKLKGKWGAINEEGDFVVEPEYEDPGFQMP